MDFALLVLLGLLCGVFVSEAGEARKKRRHRKIERPLVKKIRDAAKPLGPDRA